MGYVVFVRSQYYKNDSRLCRYLEVLGREGIPTQVICWDRSGKEAGGAGVILFKRPASFGAGVKNLSGLITWNLFILKALFNLRKETRIVHSIDLDSSLASLIFCRLFRRRLIYDVYDFYSDSRGIRNMPKTIVDVVEATVVNSAQVTILPDVARKNQISGLRPRHCLVIENVPVFQEVRPRTPDAPFKLHLAYVGILERQHRGLEDLLEVVATMPNVQLTIAGDGPLREMSELYSRKYPNIDYQGKVDYRAALELMARADVVVGMYYRTVRNHSFAAPNKYFEHLFLGKPLLTTTGTPPGDKVVMNGTGFAIQEGTQALRDLLSSTDRSDLLMKSSKARQLWLERYQDYGLKAYGSYLNCLVD